MLRVTVNTTLTSKKLQSSVWFNFEVDEPDLRSLYETLTTKGAVYGFRVTTNEVDGVRIATAKTPHILGLNAVGTIVPLTVDYREAD